MTEIYVKLSARYVVIGFVMYLAWFVVQPGYAEQLKNVGEVAVATIYASIFGALTIVIKGNFDSKINTRRHDD